VTSQVFEGVTATIEQFETIDGIWTGVATVRLEGTAVPTNAAGQTRRLPLERHVRVFVLGNCSPEVVDEQLPQRGWASGGTRGLGVRVPRSRDGGHASARTHGRGRGPPRRRHGGVARALRIVRPACRS